MNFINVACVSFGFIVGVAVGMADLHYRQDGDSHVYVGGPGGGRFFGGTVIVNVPEGTKVLELTLGSPGGIGQKGGSVQGAGK